MEETYICGGDLQIRRVTANILNKHTLSRFLQFIILRSIFNIIPCTPEFPKRSRFTKCCILSSLGGYY
jgi:hypothetical protein